MPFTFAHPAAVLPLRRIGLPTTALVVGSMAPDLPLFTSWWVGYDVTHSWLGVVTVDPLASLLVVALWFGVLRDALVDLSPSAIRSRLAPHVSLGVRRWLLVPVAAIVGSVTHVVWDAFTHRGRWGVEALPWLQRPAGPLPGYQWAQYSCGVLGCSVVAWAAYAHLRQQTLVPRARRSSGRLAVLAAGFALAAAVVAVVAAYAHGSAGYREMAYAGVVGGLTVLGVGLGAACALWWAAVGLGPSRSR